MGIAALVLFTLFHEAARPLYNAVLYLLGVRAYETPFADFEAQLAAVQCSARGIDVYLSNPCDLTNHPYNYPPFWLHVGFPPDIAWTWAVGWPIDVAFFLSLAALPFLREWRSQP